MNRFKLPTAMPIAKKVASVMIARLRVTNSRCATLNKSRASGFIAPNSRQVALENHLNKFLGVTFTDRALLWDTGIFPKTDAEAQITRPKNITFSQLEYLGDSVLSLSLKMLMLRDMPHADTGELTPMYSQNASNGYLADRFLELGLNRYAFKTAKINRLDCGKATEALLGAICLDKDFDAVLEFVEKHLYKPHNDVDPIGALNRLASKEGFKVEINETRTSDGNNGINPSFEFECLRTGNFLCSGQGRTKKEARADCAANALRALSSSNGACVEETMNGVFSGRLDEEPNAESRIDAEEWALHFDPKDPGDINERRKLYGKYVSNFLSFGDAAELKLIDTRGEGTHQPRFKVAATVSGIEIAVGIGETKKVARGVAAKLALTRYL